jgi:hypothetical protein
MRIKFQFETLDERDHLRDKGVVRRIILMLILNKYDGVYSSAPG